MLKGYWSFSINPFTPKESPFDEQNRFALDRVKSIKSVLGVKGLLTGSNSKLMLFWLALTGYELLL